MTKKFYKVTDLDDNTFSLVLVEQTPEGEKVQVAEHSSAQERVSFREVEHFTIHDYTGKVVEIDGEEYVTILNNWGFIADAVHDDVPTQPPAPVDPSTAPESGDLSEPTTNNEGDTTGGEGTEVLDEANVGNAEVTGGVESSTTETESETAA